MRPSAFLFLFSLVPLGLAAAVPPVKRDCDMVAFNSAWATWQTAWQSAVDAGATSMPPQPVCTGGTAAVVTTAATYAVVSPQAAVNVYHKAEIVDQHPSAGRQSTSSQITTTATPTVTTPGVPGGTTSAPALGSGGVVAGLNFASTTATCMATVANPTFTPVPNSWSTCTGSGNACLAAMSLDTGWIGQACSGAGMPTDDSQLLVALPQPLFDSDRNSQGSSLCGATVMIAAGDSKNFIKAIVTERSGCGVATPNGLDISTGLYNALFKVSEQPHAWREYATWYLEI